MAKKKKKMVLVASSKVNSLMKTLRMPELRGK